MQDLVNTTSANVFAAALLLISSCVSRRFLLLDLDLCVNCKTGPCAKTSSMLEWASQLIKYWTNRIYLASSNSLPFFELGCLDVPFLHSGSLGSYLCQLTACDVDTFRCLAHNRDHHHAPLKRDHLCIFAFWLLFTYKSGPQSHQLFK